MSAFSKLERKIAAKKALVGIMGMGYVGSDLAGGVAAKFSVLGFDINPEKVAYINRQKKPRLSATGYFSQLATCDVLCICVPTPLHADRSPNLTILETAGREIAKFLRPGQLVVLESSVAPGTTRELLVPILKGSGLKVGKDFFVSFSPERIDPKNPKYDFKSIPKIVSGFDKTCLNLVHLFYSKIVERVVPVSSLETAEMTKALENTFRLVNISLVNELIDFTRNLKIDLWEVIDAAATKPFGFLPHYPGPGAGGYCIPVLPRFLIQKAEEQQVTLPLVTQAIEINDLQPTKIARQAVTILKHKKQFGKKSRVLIVGIGYKPEITDSRESVALAVWKALEDRGISVGFHDPFIEIVNGIKSSPLTSATFAKNQLIIIVTAHKNLPLSTIVRAKVPILDTRNALKKFKDKNIHRL